MDYKLQTNVLLHVLPDYMHIRFFESVLIFAKNHIMQTQPVDCVYCSVPLINFNMLTKIWDNVCHHVLTTLSIQMT